jgi:hypothetical protein
MPMNNRLLRPGSNEFTPRSISGLALWLDAADTQSLYTTDAGPVTAVSAPTEISGLRTWWDFSDASTLFQNSDGTVAASSAGDRVGYVKDKVGSSNLTQATSNLRGTVVASGIGGRRCVSLPSDAASGWDFTGAALSSATWFIVAKYTGTANWLTVHSGANYVIDAIADGSGDAAFATSGTPSHRVNGVSQAGVRNTLHDAIGGANVPYLLTVTSVSHLTWPTAANAWSLGRYSSTFNFIGELGEILWFDGALSTTDRARVEAYLAAKWGISGVHTQATATSDPVGYWGDKSGNGRHMLQPSATPRPVRNTQNNRSSLSFNGTSQWMRQERTNFQMQTALIAWRRTGTPVSFASPFAANGSVAATLGGAAYVSSDAHSLTYNVGSTGNHYWGSNVAANRATAVRSLGATQSAANFAVFTSGVTLAPNTSDVALVSAVFANSGAGNKAFFAGIEPFADTRHYPCQLLEVLLYNGVLTGAQIARAERYLAAKWGITLAPQVSNADAQDWINRVYGNGGTVSAATATAVNTFCNDIDTAGIRDRFYRLNLFCGNSDASLNAVRTPLFRGPSLGGTQYGGATDTNVNFVQGDYAETGASGGLLGNGTSKYLDTGFSLASLPSAASRHISAYEIVKSANNNDTSIGGSYSLSSDGMVLGTRSPATTYTWARGGPNDVAVASSSYSGGAHWIGQNNTLRAGQLYKNGALDNSGTVANDLTSNAANTVGVLAWKITGGTPDPAWTFISAARLGGYSIGASMTDAQALAYYTAMQAFQTALGRNV